MAADSVTTAYETLDAEFKAQLAKTARFVPAAFHVHSIDSHDWGRNGDATRNDRGQFEQGEAGLDTYLDALRDAGLRIVCITDHMKCTYACALAERAQHRGDITVFPGMEVNCLIPPAYAQRIHLLAIFPAGHTPGQIERIFGSQGDQFPDDAGRSGQEEVKLESLPKWRAQIKNVGGILVVAHINQDSGHRAYVRKILGDDAKMLAIDDKGAKSQQDISEAYVGHLMQLDPDAVEISEPSESQHFARFEGPHHPPTRVACVVRSDHHSVEEFAEIAAMTHVKVSREELSCVDDALRFSDTRIRFDNDLPEAPNPRLLGLRLRSGSDSAGLFEEAVVAFNENLNCFIGPRGCGKSTIIEALRYVLGQCPRLGNGLETHGEGDRSFAGLAVATQRANLAGCEIELIYEKDRERHVLAATYDADVPLATRAFLLDGTDLEVPESGITTDYPARIFSWSELETMGRDPRLQRGVIDQLDRSLAAIEERVRLADAALAINRERVAELLEALKRLLADESGALRRYRDRKLRFDRLNTREVAAMFGDLDLVGQRISALRSLLSALEGLGEQIAAIEPTRVRQPLADPFGADPVDDSLRDWWDTEIEPLLRLEEFEGSLKEQLDAAAALVAERSEKTNAELQMLEAQAKDKEEQIRDATQADPQSAVQRDQRERARRDFEESARLRERYLQTYAELEGVLESRTALRAEIEAARRARSEARKGTAAELGGKLSQVGGNGPSITITVDRDADHGQLATWLDDEFLNQARGGGHYHQSGIARRLATSASPAQIADAILARDATAITGADPDQGLDAAEAGQLVGAFEVLRTDAGADVTDVDSDLLDLLTLQERPVNDAVRILSDGEPVDTLSPGGRSSAMLPLIALSDTAPLIIDQPEDNLDNRMVGQTLSSILAQLKEKRQIIVTTHNPNIVVGGDAEQVVVLNAPSARSAQVEQTGSIDDESIIDAVIKIMEGGKEAFEARKRRYKDHIAAS